MVEEVVDVAQAGKATAMNPASANGKRIFIVVAILGLAGQPQGQAQAV